MKNLGDRMKRYENVSRYHLTRRTPVIIRVDGKAFHTLLVGTKKPFDMSFITCMLDTAQILSEQIQGFKLAYVQSDEASFLLTDYDKLDTQGWFDYNLSKIISISSAMMSAAFNSMVHLPERRLTIYGRGIFDSRAFNIPKEEVTNYFLWRARDWQRNSLSMYARNFFLHKELMDKNSSDVHDMLWRIGKNWATDLDTILKNGSWLIKDGEWRHDILPNYQDISKIVDPLVELKDD